MLKKIVIAVMAGALLSPVGLALSKTGSKGIAPRGGSYCSHQARAAGGSHPRCVVTKTTTITVYKTVRRPVTTTKYVNRTTTTTKNVTYTTTTTLPGGEVVVTESRVKTLSVPGSTGTVTVTPHTQETLTVTDTDSTTSTTTVTTVTTIFVTEV
jgi:hypothetical protein